MPDSCLPLAVFWKWDGSVRSEVLGMAGSPAPRLDKLNHILDRAHMLVCLLEEEIQKEAAQPTKGENNVSVGAMLREG